MVYQPRNLQQEQTDLHAIELTHNGQRNLYTKTRAGKKYAPLDSLLQLKDTNT